MYKKGLLGQANYVVSKGDCSIRVVCITVVLFLLLQTVASLLGMQLFLRIDKILLIVKLYEKLHPV